MPLQSYALTRSCFGWTTEHFKAKVLPGQISTKMYDLQKSIHFRMLDLFDIGLHIPGGAEFRALEYAYLEV